MRTKSLPKSAATPDGAQFAMERDRPAQVDPAGQLVLAGEPLEHAKEPPARLGRVAVHVLEARDAEFRGVLLRREHRFEDLRLIGFGNQPPDE